jgi:adenine-specific DNA-methyltransferase
MLNTRKTWLGSKELEALKRTIEEQANLNNTHENLLTTPYILHHLFKSTGTKDFILRNFFPDVYQDIITLPALQIDATSCGYLIDYIFQLNLAQQQEDGKRHSQRKKHGAFFTPYSIAYLIVENTIDNTSSRMSVLDPACGTGVFLSAAAHFLKKAGKSNSEILHSLHGWDINPDSIKIAQCLLAAELSLTEAEQKALINSEQFIAKDTIVEPIENASLFSCAPSENYDFDYIVTNPPYDRLKADAGTDIYKKSVSDYVSIIKKSNHYPLSSDGSIDLYRLFLERMLQLSALNNSKAGMIIPASFCSDKSAQKIRGAIIAKNSIQKILFIPEKIRAFEGVTQAFVILILKNNKQDSHFSTGSIVKDGAAFKVSNQTLNCTKSVIEAFPNERNIIHLCEKGYDLIKKLNTLPRIKDIHYIQNKRGELDLSLKRQYIGHGENRLMRGIHVQEYSASSNLDLVDYQGFINSIKSTPKFNDVHSFRLCCQQISNMDSAKRLKFAHVNNNAILGNSLNYITADQSKEYLYGLMVILNSLLLDWRFRISSSNNHVNNYEINELPLPENIPAIEKLGRLFLSVQSSIQNAEIRSLLEKEVLDLYDCRPYEDFIISKHPLGEILLNSNQNNIKQYA